MLDQFSNEYIGTDYKIPENKFNSTIETEVDPRIKLVDNTLQDLEQEIEDERVARAREIVQESFAEIVKPKTEIDVFEVIHGIHSRGKNIVEARRYYLSKHPNRYPTDSGSVITRYKNKLINSFYLPNTEQDIINEIEMQIGADIFQVPGFSFFCLDEKNWYGHYQYTDSYGDHSVTIHYEVLPNGILKSSSDFGAPNEFIYGEELSRLEDSTSRYEKRVLDRFGVFGQSNESSLANKAA